ncbi:MAG: nitronate monooxygenase, partial [Gammaproteobacteria bacterium]
TALFNLGWENAEHRVLRNRDFNEWEAAGAPPPGRRPGEGATIGKVDMFGTVVDVPKYSIMPPVLGYQGDLQHAALYAGESVRLIDDIKPAATVVRDLVRETEAVLVQLRG